MIFAVTRQIFASRCSFVLVCVLNLVPGLGLDLVGGVDAQMIKLNRNLYQTKELIYRAGMQKKRMASLLYSVDALLYIVATKSWLQNLAKEGIVGES